MGWSEVVQEMVTSFRTEDGASASFAAIGDRATDLGGVLQNIERIYSTTMRAISAIQPTLMSAIHMGAARQELELTMAGTLRAYNAAGESMDSINRRFHEGTAEWTRATTDAFDNARRVASSTLAHINADAASLPGTADDYVQGLQVTLPALLAASPTRSVDALVGLQNRFIATALVNQIDAPQAGRDLMRLVQGGAGMDVRTWTTLSSLFHNPGRDTWRGMTAAQRAAAEAADPTGEHRFRGGNTRAMSAAQFNHLTGEQRVESVSNALKSYAPLLARMGETWGAQTGAFESMVTTIQRVIAAPIFEPAIHMLGQINRMLESSQEHIQRIGAYFAGYIGRAIEDLIPKVVRLYHSTLDLIRDVVNSPVFAQIFARVEQVGRAIYQALSPLMGSKTGVMGAISAVLGPLGGAIAGALGDPRMLAAFHQLADIAMQLIPGLTGLGMGLGRLSGWLSEGLIRGVQAFVGVLEFAIRVLPDVIGIFTDWIKIFAFMFQPLIAMIGAVVGMMGFKGLADVLAVAIFGIRYLAMTFAFFAALFLMIPVIILSPFIALGVAIYKLAEWIHDTFHIGGEVTNPMTALNTNSSLQGFLADIRMLMLPAKVDKSTHTPRTDTATHPQTNNDFRFSRFDITQKFADGFDPDRVATAFVNDLQAMAEAPMSSGFQPGFSSS